MGCFVLPRLFRNAGLETIRAGKMGSKASSATKCGAVKAKIDTGEVEGTSWAVPVPSGPTTVHRFLALPYAAPPTGSLRWRPPQPPAPWEGVRKTPKKLPVCPQVGGMHRSSFEGHVNEQTEDCLVLNVFTPTLDPTAKLPVLFYIHGGSGKHGTGMTPRLGGDSLAATGACFVNINYRLGVLGFCAHPELTAEHPQGSSGNYAILDQIAALEWVQRNIVNFGGDPARVTVWGLSSGAQYVTTLVCCPLAAGLFHRAMVQSCTDLANLRHREIRSDIWLNKSAEEWGVEYGAQELGCPAGPGQIEAMRQVSIEKLLETSDTDSATDFYESCIDGYVKRGGTAQLLAAGEFNHVPLMIGYTGDDGLGSDELEHHMYELENLSAAKYKALMAREFGEEHVAEALSFFPINDDDDDTVVDKQLAAFSRQLWYDASSWIMAKEMTARSCPAWFYIFDEKVPLRSGGEKKSFHGADVPFWHGSDPAALGTPVGNAMIRYLLQFAASGDPNGGVAEGLPEWPRFRPEEVDGALQLGGLGPDSVAAYVPLRPEDRALYSFMDEHYFSVSGRMGKILGTLPPLPDRQSAM